MPGFRGFRSFYPSRAIREVPLLRLTVLHMSDSLVEEVGLFNHRTALLFPCCLSLPEGQTEQRLLGLSLAQRRNRG